MLGIDEISIYGYKSIKELKNFKLNSLNVLIGANGAGKSNFLSFFKFLQKYFGERNNNYITINGGADAFLYFGRKVTSSIRGQLALNGKTYDFKCIPTVDNDLFP